MKKPTIAAINGAAIGVGITMALPMDIRLASEKATFGFVFSRLGITIEACSSWFLPRIVGPGKALEWSCTGRIFNAAEALSAAASADAALISDVGRQRSVETGALYQAAGSRVFSTWESGTITVDLETMIVEEFLVD